MQVPSLGQKDPLEEGMATHSSILAWRIPWIKEAGGLQSIGSQSQTQLKLLSTHAHLWWLQGLMACWLQHPLSNGMAGDIRCLQSLLMVFS